MIFADKMILFVNRLLNNTQLKELPGGVFDNNTELMFL